MTARDVHDVVLARLPALGSPGDRLFPDPDTDRERAWKLIDREYVEALQQFDRTTLERAFARVRDNATTGFWPSPGKFRQAALALTPEPPDADATKQRDAEHRARAYVSRFLRTSQLYREAKRRGWAGDLLDYVQAAASVQAQAAAGTRGISWDKILLDPASSVEPRAQILALVEEHRRRGPAEIKVTVPKSRITAWRGLAAQRPTSADPQWQDLVARLTTRPARGGGPG